jgi:hypothetical protein
MRATNKSWKHLPPPSEREPLGFEAFFTNEEAERMMLGLIPEEMEDKWFIYYEEGWLRFHRSWTGAFIYALQLDSSPAGVQVADSWVNRNQQQYTASDIAYDRRLVRFLIDAFLLKKSDAPFPMPENVADAQKGIVQHSLVGRGYPEPKSRGDA